MRLPARRRPQVVARWALQVALLCAFGMPAVPAAAATPEESVAGDYRYCTVCHGATGNGNVSIQAPTLAGIEEWYLRARLQAYRGQQLGHDFAADPAGTEMRTVARELGDERLAAIAGYVAALPAEALVATVGGNAAAGRKLYAAQCAACHGTRGEGNPLLRAPGLARLNDWYIVAAFGKYRLGLRGAQGSDPYAQQMRALAAALGPDLAINDIATYLRSRSR